MHGSGGPIAFYQQVSVVGCTGSVCSAPLFVEIFPFFLSTRRAEWDPIGDSGRRGEEQNGGSRGI